MSFILSNGRSSTGISEVDGLSDILVDDTQGTENKILFMTINTNLLIITIDILEYDYNKAQYLLLYCTEYTNDTSTTSSKLILLRLW